MKKVKITKSQLKYLKENKYTIKKILDIIAPYNNWAILFIFKIVKNIGYHTAVRIGVNKLSQIIYLNKDNNRIVGIISKLI